MKNEKKIYQKIGSRRIYNFFIAYQKNEKIFSNNNWNNDNFCYVIDANLIEQFKRSINYERLKRILNNETINDYNNVKHLIEKECNCDKIIKKNIVQCEFNNSKKLMKELKNNKQFHLNF